MKEDTPAGADKRLATADAAALLAALPGWRIEGEVAGGQLCKEFRFADYAATIRFVVAVAAIAEEEDHHPDLAVGYGRVGVSFTTHDCGGLSDKDFRCAGRVATLARSGKEAPGAGAAS
ncbi:4a-hydroxytetrahydrobiopterin dehydratase [Rhodocyclus tenuis]|uniref:4a-hydroxytetrahydrobiopterin dehydratase n=1 Tax=Rhodocyclus tenuis TaxID=1066 RepID=UPI001906EB6C|nr:4a-hydroxytetrahydrobiopterin dehydratase [Rhodocyclus tenuis]MBK1679414.1 4a-hydroxytetrahydrobiopterin dehydratase [Rhodocyclus tenuis]